MAKVVDMTRSVHHHQPVDGEEDKPLSGSTLRRRTFGQLAVLCLVLAGCSMPTELGEVDAASFDNLDELFVAVDAAPD